MAIKPGTFGIFFADEMDGKDPLLQLLYTWLVYYANMQDGHCFPSISTLSKKTGMGERTVQRKLKELEDLSLIKITARKKNNDEYTSNDYEVFFPNGGVTESPPLVSQSHHPGVIESPPLVSQRRTNNNYINNNQLTDNNICPIAPQNDYSEEFNTMWSYYPSRGKGADNNKMSAYRCWKGLIKKGITADKLLHAVTGYQLYCNKSNITGTTYVKMTTTFLGRDKHYETNWGEKAHAAADEATRKNESTMSATSKAYANLRKLGEHIRGAN